MIFHKEIIDELSTEKAEPKKKTIVETNELDHKRLVRETIDPKLSTLFDITRLLTKLDDYNTTLHKLLNFIFAELRPNQAFIALGDRHSLKVELAHNANGLIKDDQIALHPEMIQQLLSSDQAFLYSEKINIKRRTHNNMTIINVIYTLIKHHQKIIDLLYTDALVDHQRFDDSDL